MRLRTSAIAAVISLLGGSAAWATASTSPDPCKKADRACVRATAQSLLDAMTHQADAAAVPLADDVAVYDLGQAPEHKAGAAAAERHALTKSTVARIDHEEWTIDGDVAFVAYRAHTRNQPTDFVASRITLKDGLIWEVMSDVQHGRATGGGTPNTPVVEVTGTPAQEPPKPDYTNAFYCTDRIAEHGDDSMTPEQHRSCMIAIAQTYVDGEENSAPGNWILFDPRFCRVSLGGTPDHEPSNSDLIRTQEGRYQGTYNRVIRQITDRQWTVDGDTVWIVYKGYLVTSTDHPGFNVAERFTIRNGLIWEIMIAPVVTQIP